MICTVKARKLAIYVNSGLRDTDWIKAETGCDAVINGGLYDMARFQPVCHLKVDGKVLARDAYSYWGYGWNAGDAVPAMVSAYADYDNYICCVALVRGGQRETMYYDAAMGGARARTALGVMPDGRLWLYADKTALTPKELQQIALDAGVASAVMLDGGGSTQGVFPDGSRVLSGRIVHNYICVWAADDDKEDKPVNIDIIDPCWEWAGELTMQGAITRIILHHAAATSCTAQDIHDSHLKRGWKGIAYHYFVDKAGQVFRGRPEWAKGGHTSGYDDGSIGICAEGNFELDTMPAVQREALRAVVAWLRGKYPAAQVVGHRDLNATACPGANFPFAYIAGAEGGSYVQAGPIDDKADATALFSELAGRGYAVTLLGGGEAPEPEPEPEAETPQVGDKVSLQAGAPVYGKTSTFAAWVYNSTLYLRQLAGDRAVISTKPTGSVTGAVDIKYLTKI